MTEVLCTFDECIYYKLHDECYGVCTKERIILDEEVSGRTCGCPDAEWDEPQREVIACPIIDDDAWIYKDESQRERSE